MVRCPKKDTAGGLEGCDGAETGEREKGASELHHDGRCAVWSGATLCMRPTSTSSSLIYDHRLVTLGRSIVREMGDC